MKRVLIAGALALLLSACSALKVTEVDPKTGYFPTTVTANVVVNKPADLDARKSLVLVPRGQFERGQIHNIKYFNEVMNVEELETRIIQAQLGDKVPSVRDRIGISNAAKHYKDFLWFRYERVGQGNDLRGRFALTDPVTMEDLFVTETKLDYVWAGVNDQRNWYPMFNALIDYIRQNSKTYRR